MEQQRYEPLSNGIPPQPSSTAILSEAEYSHPAATGWLQPGSPAVELLADESPPPTDAVPSTPAYRRDGWTPQRRADFLAALAETGMITRACAAVGLSRQSANALCTRDPVFAASVDAACLLARQPLADSLYEQAMEGVVETVTRNGEVVAERRRFDLRLSLAVLNRLDKRCDRALEAAGPALALMQRWDEWLRLVAQGVEKGAFRDLELTCAKKLEQRQVRQLPLRPNPICESPAVHFDSLAPDCADRCWQDEDGRWITTFPPPPGFEGDQRGVCDGGNYYERACTEEECAILDGWEPAVEAQTVTEDAQQRDSYFASLKADIDAAAGLVRGH